MLPIAGVEGRKDLVAFCIASHRADGLQARVSPIIYACKFMGGSKRINGDGSEQHAQCLSLYTAPRTHLDNIGTACSNSHFYPTLAPVAV